MKPLRLACLLLGWLPLLGGCAAQRLVRVTSEPPGALVRIDGRRVGTTPVDVPFEYYGIRRITLYMEGFHTHSEQRAFEPPFYGHFPLDILSEVVIPIGWRDRLHFHAVLVRGDDSTRNPGLRSVLERAGTLRHAPREGPLNLPAPVPAQLPEFVEDPGGAGRAGSPASTGAAAPREDPR